jgi:siderophore synthetase component
VNREDGADRDVHIDVRAAIERVEHEHVLAVRIARGDRDDLVVLLARHHADMAARLDAADERAVRHVIELLHRLALDVHGTCRTEHISQARLRHLAADDAAGEREALEEPGEITARTRDAALTLEDVAIECPAKFVGACGCDGSVRHAADDSFDA